VRKALFLLCILAPSGCALRTLTVRATASALEAGKPAVLDESDPELAREALPSQLKLLEALLPSDPGNRKVLEALSEGFTGYSFLFVEDEHPRRAAALYRRALAYALRLSALNPKLSGLEALGPEGLENALRKAGPRDVPGLYWAAYAWAGWANLAKNDPEALSGLPKAERIMARVLELDPGFQFGGPDLWFGVYFAERPRIAGGDPRKSKAHFEAALSRSSGRFLTAKLLEARHYAVCVLDEDLFKSLLSEVLRAPAGALPGSRLSDEVAKLKAAKLLEKAHEIF
jgi:hypothetical protein